MSFKTTFGILTRPLSLALPKLRIEPLPDLNALVERFRGQSNKDGHYYPPMSEQVSFPDWPDETRKEPVPQTSRPAQLFRLPPSHSLELLSPCSADPHSGDAAFVVQLLAYLHGTRLQLTDWQFDSRIPLDSNHHVWLTRASIERFVSSAYDNWSAKPPERQLRLTNILYLHAKAPAYDWTWENFLMEYIVTDAIYDYCSRSYVAIPVEHAGRIRELCSRLGLWCPPDAPIPELVEMRNSLFHEGLWEGEKPGYKITAPSRDRVFLLRYLNQKLIAAALGGATAYTRSSWLDWRQMVDFA